MNTTTFYFNSGVKPWNTDVDRQVKAGNKFVNNELHIPYVVEGEIPDNLKHVCLMDNPFEHYNENYFIIAKIVGGNMASKYAVFHKPLKPYTP